MSYSKFKRYGQSFSEHYWGDYIHNIWLRYFDKTGKDLFKEKLPSSWIFRAVKNEFINSLYRNERFDDIVKAVFDEDGEGDEEEYIPSNEPSILDNLMYNELDHFIKDQIKAYVLRTGKLGIEYHTSYKKLFEVYELIKLGHTNQSIADQLGIWPTEVGNYKKQIREAINHMVIIKNPFNGSRTVVTKSISLNTWNGGKRFDHIDYEMEDENEFCILYVHIESREGLLVRLPEEKVNQYIVNQHNKEKGAN